MTLLKFLAESNTVNFVIMVILLGCILKKIQLGKMLDKVSDTIKNTIDKSENTKLKSVELLNKSKKRLEILPDDIKAIEQTTQDKINAFKTDIKIGTENTISELNRSINKIIEIEEKKVSNNLTNKTSKEVIETARSRLTKMLEDNSELHNQFIQQSLNELDKVKIL